jgi:hypothetical protein
MLNIDDNDLNPIDVIIDSKNVITSTINEGVFKNMSNEDYHSIDGISSTQFQDMELSIAIFKNREIFKYDCEAFVVGNLIHTALLEPHLLDDYLECSTAKADTVQAIALAKKNPDKIIVPKGLIEVAKEIAKKVMLVYGKFIVSSLKESSVIVHNNDTGMIHKCRPDIWMQQSGIILDLKSSKETTHLGFENTIEKYNYHLSAAWYVDTCNYLIEKLNLNIPKVTQFGWIIAPKFVPHKPFAFICSSELLEKGREKYNMLLEKYKSVRDGGKDELFKTAYSFEYRKNNN